RSARDAVISGHRYCTVRGTVAPAINFEVRLPVHGWTQRSLQTGCGGLCGFLGIRVEHDTGCTPVTDGSIVLASTDMGHTSKGFGSGDESWASNPQMRIDFAYRGVHVTAQVVKALMIAYYGQKPRYAYFSGCSDGGREALIEAQRYPDDFDGIAAGAPALNFAVQNSFYHGWMAKSNMDASAKPIINPVDLPVLHQAALDACDANDGLKDLQISDPRTCHFDPGIVQCKGAYEAGKCLTPEQVATARKFYGGAVDAQGHKLVVGSVMPGSELEWAGVFVPRTNGGTIGSINMALGTINNLLFIPNPAPGFTVNTFPFSDAALASEEPARRLYAADNPDLSGFAAHGAKLLLWHGWSDPHISPLNTIDYYNRVGILMGAEERDTFVKLFLFPGMSHCGGGDGPNEFPLLATLMAWVEDGVAPQEMVAHTVPESTPPGMPPDLAKSDLPPAPFIARARPVYAYPLVATYKGSGDINDAASFAAAAPANVDDQPIDWLGHRTSGAGGR
ncbi:MAG: tannase/feruloyl esterase family alpha/beta hydrolase, partial [Alphaproteobacteria bacterium]|nr:tannase/feruloyl esterase family alpha/beta hydrolase [Alphaproteobacteria bacterium]